MTDAQARLDRLRRWPDLWRYPALFGLVHASDDRPVSREALVEALLVDAPASREDAWSQIFKRDDLGATQHAYELLALDLGLDAVDKGMTEARSAFRRRVQRIGWRAHVVNAGRADIEAQLQGALDLLADDPVAAERLLRSAERTTEIAEERDLEALAKAHPLEDGNQAGLARLHEAIAARDLRLAHVYASHLDTPLAPPQPLGPESWLDRTPLVELISWRLNPSFAPARLAPVELTECEILLLSRIDKALTSERLAEADAEQLLRATLAFAAGAEVASADLTPVRQTGDDVFAFEVKGKIAATLFPVSADDEGTAQVVMPAHRSTHFPHGKGLGRFVAFDLFDQWKLEARHDSVRLTARMLVDLVAIPDRRAEALVRLQSRLVGVRSLLLELVGQDELRARRLAGGTEGADRPVDAMLSPMLGALDLYVDEVDILALDDACGGNLTLLLRILAAVTKNLSEEQLSGRRFDVAGVLLSETGAAIIEGIVEEDLNQRLGDRRDDAEAGLAIVDYEIEQRASHARQEPSRAELVKIILDEGWSEDEIQAETLIDWMTSLNLLSLKESDQGPLVHRRFGLPYRMLLNP